MMEKIYNLYTDPKTPGSFSGVSGFIKNNKKLKNTNVKKVLSSLPSVTLHKPILNKFQRSKTLVAGIDDQWQIDLLDVQNIKGSNFNNKYIFTCIDVFSKFAWAIPILNKEAKSSFIAFKSIIESSGRKPKFVYCDDGNEFKEAFESYVKKLNIKISITRTKNKAAIVERFNRTLKNKMYRFFSFMTTAKNISNLERKRYIEVLPQLLESYNNSYHRSIKTKPSLVNQKNENIIYLNLYGFKKQEGDDTLMDIKFKVGTYVRIAETKKLFEKGYTANWSDDIYIICKVIAQNPVLYQLERIDIKNNKLTQARGTWYEQELQEVQLPYDTFQLTKDNNLVKINSE